MLWSNMCFGHSMAGAQITQPDSPSDLPSSRFEKRLNYFRVPYGKKTKALPQACRNASTEGQPVEVKAIFMV